MSVATGVLIAIAAVSLGACAKPAPSLTVPQVIARIHALDGQVVRVRGYLASCAGYSCSLFVDEAGFRAMKQRIGEIQRVTQPGNTARVTTAEPPVLGIGGFPDFDRKAAPFQNGMVVITGKVTDGCRGSDGRPGCTDRSTDIKPTDIVSLKDQ